MIMFQGFRAVQDTLSSLSEVLASPEAGDSEDEAERGRDQGAGEGDQEGEQEGEEQVAGAGERVEGMGRIGTYSR